MSRGTRPARRDPGERAAFGPLVCACPMGAVPSFYVVNSPPSSNILRKRGRGRPRSTATEAGRLGLEGPPPGVGVDGAGAGRMQVVAAVVLGSLSRSLTAR